MIQFDPHGDLAVGGRGTIVSGQGLRGNGKGLSSSTRGDVGGREGIFPLAQHIAGTVDVIIKGNLHRDIGGHRRAAAVVHYCDRAADLCLSVVGSGEGEGVALIFQVRDIYRDILGAVGGIIEEFDTDDNLIWSTILDSDSYTFHHDFKQIDENTIIALTWELKAYNGNNYWNEKIVKIDKSTSSITWEWSAMDDGSILPTGGSPDYLHFNSIDYKDGQVLVSSRNQNQIYIIDETTKAIIATYTAGNTLDSQHDASFLDNGNILVFNNMATGTVSKVLELDTDDNIVWEYSSDFYSNHISGAQRLENGNTLICSGVEGKFIEVSQDKEVVWEYTNSYRNTTPRGESISVFKVRKYADYN